MLAHRTVLGGWRAAVMHCDVLGMVHGVVLVMMHGVVLSAALLVWPQAEGAGQRVGGRAGRGDSSGIQGTRQPVGG